VGKPHRKVKPIKRDVFGTAVPNKAITISNNDAIAGSRPLSNDKREKYCRSRALMMPRVSAYKSSGLNVATYAGVNAARAAGAHCGVCAPRLIRR
jgi:hypothetical protein